MRFENILRNIGLLLFGYGVITKDFGYGLDPFSYLACCIGLGLFCASWWGED